MYGSLDIKHILVHLFFYTLWIFNKKYEQLDTKVYYQFRNQFDYRRDQKFVVTRSSVVFRRKHNICFKILSGSL